MLTLADCAVAVSNARRSADWWVEKLGFAEHTVGNGGHALMVAPPGDRFVLHLCEGFGAVEPGNTGIAFVTDEFDALVRRMEKEGVEFPEPAKVESWGGMAKFADPDGNVFWLMGAPTEFVKTERNRVAGVPKKATRPLRRVRARK